MAKRRQSHDDAVREKFVPPTLYCEGSGANVRIRSPERNGRVVAAVFTGGDDVAFIIEACNYYAENRKEIQYGQVAETVADREGQMLQKLNAIGSLFRETRDKLKGVNIFMGIEETTKTLEQSLGMLSDIRGGFIEVAKLFREVEGIGKKYVEVIKGQLPIWEASGEYKFDAGEVDDKKYFKRITSIYGKKSDEERLQICIALVKDLNEVLASFRSKERKLSKRCEALPRMVKGDDGKQIVNPEYTQALDIHRKCQATVRIFEARLKDAYTRFFRYRRTIIRRIIGETERMCQLFRTDDALDTYDTEFALDYEHFGIADQLREVRELDERVRKSRLNFRKGVGL